MAELYVDQAAGLRRLFTHKPLRIVTFVSGSSGVGKSTLVANLAASLGQRGKTVLIFDENTKKTVSSHFGVTSQNDLFQIVNGERDLADVLVPVSPGVKVLPAAEAMKKLGALSQRQQRILMESLLTLEGTVDVILVDASRDYPLGFSPLGLVAHSTVVVMTTTAASITDAYALIKNVSLGHSCREYRVVVNGARSPKEARSIFRNVSQVAHSRGVARLDFCGGIPLDEHFQQAANLGQPVGALFPQTMAANVCQKLAEKLLNWNLPENKSDGLEDFIQQLLYLSRYNAPVALPA